MKKSKKGVSLLLVFAMLLTMIPMFGTVAYATDPAPHNLYIGFDGTGRNEVSATTEGDFHTLTPGGLYCYYYDSTKGMPVLVLSGASITANDEACSVCWDDDHVSDAALCIKFIGDNYADAADRDNASFYFPKNSKLILDLSEGNLHLEELAGRTATNSMATGIETTNLELVGNGELSYCGYELGIAADTIDTSNFTGTVNMTAKGTEFNKACMSFSEVGELEGGTYNLSATSTAILANNLTITNSTVNIIDAATGILAMASVSINNSDVTIHDKNDGIKVIGNEFVGLPAGSITITGGNTEIEDEGAECTVVDFGSCALHCGGNITINGGSHTFTSENKYGIYTTGGSLTITNAAIEIYGGGTATAISTDLGTADFTGNIRYGETKETATTTVSALDASAMAAHFVALSGSAILPPAGPDTNVVRVAGEIVSLNHPYYHNGPNGAVGTVNETETGANLSVAEDGAGGYIVTLNNLVDYPPSSINGELHRCGIEVLVTDAAYKFVIKGDNYLGSSVKTSELATHENYSICVGIGPDTTSFGQIPTGNYTFEGNGNLTIYDSNNGILSDEDVIFGDDFTGKINIYDCGVSLSLCCINANNLTIKNGTFNLVNQNTKGIQVGKNFNLIGGNVTVTAPMPIGITNGIANLEGGKLTLHATALDGDIKGANIASGIYVKNLNSENILTNTVLSGDTTVKGAEYADFHFRYSSASNHGVILRNSGTQDRTHSVVYSDSFSKELLSNPEAFPVEAVKYQGGSLTPEPEKFTSLNGYVVLQGAPEKIGMTDPKSLYIHGEVKFVSNGGSYVTPCAIGDNSLFDLSIADPTREGYTFCGWYQDAKFIKSWNKADKLLKPMTLYASWAQNSTAPKITVEVFKPTGEHHDYAEVFLWKGNTKYAQSGLITTGVYEFTNVFPGEYQIVAMDLNGSDPHDQATAICVITDSDKNVDVTIYSNKESVVEVTPETPDIVVGGVDIISSDGAIDTLTKFRAASEADTDGTTYSAIRTLAGENSKVDFIDMKLTQEPIGGGTVTDIGSTNDEILEILIPYDTSRYNIGVYRKHSTEAAMKLTQLSTRPAERTAFQEGSYYVGGNYIAVYAKKFSTYAISYTETPTAGPTGGGGHSTTKPAITPSGIARPSETGVDRYLITDDHIIYINGRDNGMVEPQANMTRAEAAQMFYNLLKNKNITVTASFSDVTEGAWYAKAVGTLATMGIINGKGQGTFAPNATISRAEFTAMAMRFAFETTGRKEFTDVTGNYWAHDLIGSAASYGWINGYSNGTFNPNGKITRAEVVTIMNHILGRSADQAYVNAHFTSLKQFPDLQNKTVWYFYDMTEATNAHDYTFDANFAETWK